MLLNDGVKGSTRFLTAQAEASLRWEVAQSEQQVTCLRLGHGYRSGTRQRRSLVWLNYRDRSLEVERAVWMWGLVHGEVPPPRIKQ